MKYIIFICGLLFWPLNMSFERAVNNVQANRGDIVIYFDLVLGWLSQSAWFAIIYYFLA